MDITKEQLEEIREKIAYCQDAKGYYMDNLEGLFDLVLSIFGTETQKRGK